MLFEKAGVEVGDRRNDMNKSKRLVCAYKGRRREWREKERHEQIKKDSFVPVKVDVVKGKKQRVV